VTMTTSTMRTLISICLPVVLLLVGPALSAPGAGSAADFMAAYAAAEAAEAEAGRLRNRWTVTETALAEASKAAEGGDFDRAIAAAREAEALAKASIFQAENEVEAWKNLELR
jgi:hypothetical protein